LKNGNIELGVHIADVSYYVKEGSALDKEALRVVSKMPAWNPGRNGNKKVATKYTLPVKFSLGSK